MIQAKNPAPRGEHTRPQGVLVALLSVDEPPGPPSPAATPLPLGLRAHCREQPLAESLSKRAAVRGDAEVTSPHFGCHPPFLPALV